MLTLLVAVALTQGQDPIVPIPRPGMDGRGRDPWVFRSIFEDRTRMLVIAPRNNWWMVFNPETCAMHKIWEGKMDFRGKVWDFSQDNSRSEGRVHYAAPNEIWRFPDVSENSNGYLAVDLTHDKGAWNFSTARAQLSTPHLDLTDWHRVFIAFDETGKKGRFRVDVSGTQPQWFTSATSVGGENDWQWNFKRLERPEKDTVVKVTTQVSGKKLRNLRIYGDKYAWFDSNGKPLETLWDGYTLHDRTAAVDIRFRLKLPNGKVVTVTQRPELRQSSWEEKFEISGLPKDMQIQLRREGLSNGVSTNMGKGIYNFDVNGTHRLTFNVQGEQK